MAGSTTNCGRAPMRARLPFWTAVTLLWAVVAAVALEAGTVWYEQRIERSNPLIRAHLAGQSGDVPVLSYAPGCALVAADGTALHLTQPVSARVPGAAFPADALLEADAASPGAMAPFPKLSEEDRQSFALTRGEVVFALNARGEPLRSYGNPVSCRVLNTAFSGLRGWIFRQTAGREFVRALRAECGRAAAGEKGFAEMPPMPPEGARHPLLRSPGKKGGEAAYLFIQVCGAPAAGLPEDSPWDTPYFRYKPNLRQARGSMGNLLDTNRFGYHDTDFAVPKPQGTFRILCLGGSTTEEGESIGATYPKQLETLLRAAHPNAAVEVINCGVSGMYSGAQPAKLAEYLSYQPDLVILYEGINDLLEMFPMVEDLYPERAWWPLLRRSRFVRAAWPNLVLPDDAALRAGLRGLVMDNLEFMKKAFESRGIAVALCTVPYPHPDRLSPAERQFFDHDARTHWGCPWLSYACYVRLVRLLNEELEDWSRQEGLCLVPLDREFAEVPGVFVDVCHMNARGIEHKARAVMQALAGSAGAG